MKILEIQSSLLTNEEVLTHIIDVKAKNESNPEFTKRKARTRDDGSTAVELSGKLRELNYMCGDIIKHFSHADSPLSHTAQTPRTSTQSNPSKAGTEEDATTTAKTAALIQRLKSFNLTKSEVLMLANHRPRNETVLEALVEEVEERFGPEQQESVLRVVREVYGGDVDMEG